MRVTVLISFIYPLTHHLVRIPEIRIALLENLLAPLGLRILPLEVQRQGADEDDNEHLGAHGHAHAGNIPGCVLRAEYGGSHDTPDRAKADECCGAEGSFPLSAAGERPWSAFLGFLDRVRGRSYMLFA